MKVLVCIPCLLTGGTEIQTLSLVSALVSAGHDVTVACYFEHTPEMVNRYKEAGKMQGVTVDVRLLSHDGSRPKGIRAKISHLWRGLKDIVRDVRPDVAHVQYMAPGAIPILILRSLGVKKIVTTAHTSGDIYSKNGLRVIQFLNNHVLSGFQCITERAERSFFGLVGQPVSDGQKGKKHGNHFTIYNCLPDYIKIKKKSENEEKNIKLLQTTCIEHLAQNTITIGVVSRLEKIKGMDLVIPAFIDVYKKFQNIKLLIVGDGSLYGKMKKDAEDFLSSTNNNNSDIICFAGRLSQKQLQEYYDKIDLLLIPSRSEGFGLTAIEGMARGCVPIAANTGGLPEVIVDGVSGVIHECENIEDLSAKIKLLIQNKFLHEEISKNAIERAKDYSFDNYCKSINKWYLNL